VVQGVEVTGRLDAILDFPRELVEYERWVEATVREAPGRGDDYLFGQPRARFVPDDADVLVKAEGLSVSATSDGSEVRLAPTTSLKVASVAPSRVERVLSMIDGVRPLAAIPTAAGVEYGELMAVLRPLFGAAIFAPEAVESLERELSGTEITRFAGAPYEIERPYWRNMIAVRRACGDLDALAMALTTNESASRFLRRLHVIALMGEDLCSYYKPASPISARGVGPGAFLTGSARTLDTPHGTLFLDGPRANVSFIGGELYHRTLYAVLDDPRAFEPRSFDDADGLNWGHVVRARARHDEHVADWFCPPRPLTEAHLERLFGPLRSAIQLGRIRQSGEVVRQLARFHYHFVHLHPFRCANQCIAMSLVNQVLAQSHGAGMPHHILDQLALRLAPEAYERAFATAVAVYVLPQASPLERYRELAGRKARFYAFVERLARAGSTGAALDVVKDDLESARLALFSA
jgi:hypothetical protein